MGKQKSPTSTSPQVVATISSLLLLVVSAGLGFYFTELRGPGFRALLSGSQASELLVLLGGLAAVVLTGHLAIANAARSAQGASAYRKLVRKASEVDYSDSEAVAQFDSVPELRDLVSVLIAEKEQGHQLQDSLESARGETRGLYDGMERSLKDFGKMREEQPSELGQKVAALWNVLVERVQEAEVKSSGSPAPVSAELSSEQGYELGATAMEQRLLDLEARVQEMQAAGAVGASQVLITEDEIVASQVTPLLMPEEAPEVIDLEGDLEPASPLQPLQQGSQLVEDSDLVALEPLVEEEVQEVQAAQVEAESAPTFAGPWQHDAAPTSPQPVFDSDAAVEESLQSAPEHVTAFEPGVVPVTPVAAPQEQTTQGLESDATVEEGAEENAFSEWSGVGFGSLSSLAQESTVGFGAAPPPVVPKSHQSEQDSGVGFGKPVASPAPAQAFSFTPTATPASSEINEEVDNGSKMSFPEFGAPKGDRNSDRVEVTYDGSTVVDTGDDFMSFDAPAEEALIDDGPTYEVDDDAVDLKSLGAMETQE